MLSIKAVTFDLDDTLWAIAPVIIEAERHLHGWLAENCPETARRYDIEDMRRLREEVAGEFPEYAHDLSELRRLSFQRSARSV